jgi:ACR3 family arsenite transporter
MAPKSSSKESALAAAGDHTAATSSPSPATGSDAEKQDAPEGRLEKRVSAFKSLGWLDRFLAIWILLAMVLGVLLGNFVPETGPALQKGKFMDVSVPIGNAPRPTAAAAARIFTFADGIL